jgi:hypothetical protein
MANSTSLKLFGAPVIQAGVQTLPVVEHFDGPEHRRAGLGFGGEAFVVSLKGSGRGRNGEGRFAVCRVNPTKSSGPGGS